MTCFGRAAFAAVAVATIASCSSAPPQEAAAPAPIAESEAPRDARPAAFTALAAPSPDALQGAAIRVWATNYYTPVYQTGAEGLPLLGPDNQALSGLITRTQWCNAALQGSVSLEEPGGAVTAYVFADQNGPEQTNCDDRLGTLSQAIKTATRKVRFNAVDHPYGCGVRGWPLIPYRTIAVDPGIIAYQTTLYLPALAGKTFEIDGAAFTHDGFVFAADRGGAIKDTHIDFFSGNSRRVSFPDVVTSNENRTVDAFIVSPDSPQAAALAALHSAPCTS
ncbi:MAG: 3D domain-containing protein [Pseudomonadota bacterium]